MYTNWLALYDVIETELSSAGEPVKIAELTVTVKDEADVSFERAIQAIWWGISTNRLKYVWGHKVTPNPLLA